MRWQFLGREYSRDELQDDAALGVALRHRFAN